MSTHTRLVWVGSVIGCAAGALVACSSGSDGGTPTTSLASSTPRAAASSSASAAGSTADDRAGPVDIGDGRQIYLMCRGSGTPTVVLVSGFGDNAEIWNTPAEPAPGPATSPNPAAGPPTVYAGVAKFARVCAYDRPGTGDSRSTDVPQPTTAQGSADDLAALLAASGESRPYVLVGHSYGGPIIRLFASGHPDEVAGLVLVDALAEDLDAGLTPEQRALFQELNTPPPVPGVESVDFSAVAAQMRQAPPAPDGPVVVLTADTPQLTPEVLASGQLPPGVDQAFADSLWTAQMAAQDQLAAKFPGATHVSDTNSDHYIQLGNPQLVIDSIRQVVAESGPEPSR